MAGLDEFIDKQKDGARFVITAQMLRLPVPQFDSLALGWIANGGPGFAVSGMPHRVVLDGRFFISRVTVVKDGAPA